MRLKMLRTTVVLVLLGAVTCEVNNTDNLSSILVTTSNGVVRGAYGESSHADKTHILYWFRSIPFAEPPVGDLRFEAPVPKKNWSGILDVTEKLPECIQATDPVRGSEDCLHLKIYTRHKPSASKNLPVLVWIYGGAFYGGSADFDDHSPDYLLEEDVIVVAIHYRVGIFGFLSTGDTVAPGNNGIRDQILALKWIKNNIRNFGGDPNKITIWGQSAGAASVAYLLQIEETKDLFRGAILNSGSTLSPWSLSRNVPSVVKTIAKNLNVNTQDSTTILAGLKKVDTSELQTAAAAAMTSTLMNSNPMHGLVFAPVTEPEHPNAVITKRSHELLNNGSFHHVPIVTGYTSLEGYFESLPAILRLWLAKYDVNPALIVPEMNAGAITRYLLGNRIKREYFGILPIATTSNGLRRFISDSQFERSIQEAIRLYSAFTDVYAYHFSYQGPLWGRNNRVADGVGHTEDLGYLFDFGYEGSEADYLTRSRMIKLWTNFVKTGKPTSSSDPLLQNISWPANSKVASAENLKYLEVNKDLSITGLPNSEKITFWNRLYKSYGNPPYYTY